MCIICEASKSKDNKVAVPNTGGDVLDLVTGKVTDKDGNEYDAPMLAEIVIDAMAAEGIYAAEQWANKGADDSSDA